MKKLYILAALLMATTSAHAGGMIASRSTASASVSKRRATATRCPASRSSAPGYHRHARQYRSQGLGSKSKTTMTTSPTPAPRRAAGARSGPGGRAAAGRARPQRHLRPLRPPSHRHRAGIRSCAARPASGARTAVAAAPAPPAGAGCRGRADPTSPLGIWATEENKGNVRIEECGANLCGYAVKTGEKILINMKPQGAKWTGRIHDPDSGRNYDSTIAMKGTNTLKVQGCAFGGMFCGGQTWKRVS